MSGQLLLKMEDQSSGIINDDHQTSSSSPTTCQEVTPAKNSGSSFEVEVDGESGCPQLDDVTSHKLSSSSNAQPEGGSENASRFYGGSLDDLMGYRSSSLTGVTR